MFKFKSSNRDIIIGIMETVKSHSEAATRSTLLKNLFLKISQNSQENTCAKVSFLITLQAWDQQLF